MNDIFSSYYTQHSTTKKIIFQHMAIGNIAFKRKTGIYFFKILKVSIWHDHHHKGPDDLPPGGWRTF